MENEIFVPITVVKRGSAKMRIQQANDIEINKPLRRALVKAYKWENDLINSEDAKLYIAINKLSRRYLQRVLKLNCLSPKIKKAIMEGTFPKDILLEDIIRNELNLLWSEQEKQLLRREGE